jgi:hypothetical protein
MLRLWFVSFAISEFGEEMQLAKQGYVQDPDWQNGAPCAAIVSAVVDTGYRGMEIPHICLRFAVGEG